ncbi:polyphosphate polymerase domain-containing protein [Flavobacterium sp.]|uniref:polyphosphate polymerase domain-containing protein n=1 Tax=Flavobacterium sp. TaxID=239 RepID=UPI002C596083|nr:polyphosphate polymerase domain-containing protein [Flavobacterium sp.]HQA74080.1 polyphosphate polymerase domain-containing protein [Flavobacterium sp.]
MIDQFLNKVATMPPVSLAELDSVALQNRIDSKYVLNEDGLMALMPCLSDNYKVLSINGLLSFTYENNYFDTKDLLFYKDHHNGYVNRIKVRSRKYVESNLCYFEIKKKEKVNRTNKHRVSLDKIASEINNEKQDLVQSFTRKNLNDLKLILKNNFKRITFVNNDFTERVTIDFNLQFSDSSNEVNLDTIIVLEIKQSKSTQESPLVTFLRKSNTRENSFSKYIFGVISLHPEMKKNNFLPIIKNLTKIQK